MENKGIVPMNETCLILIPKSDKDIIRKLRANLSHEHRCENPEQNDRQSNPMLCSMKKMARHK